MTKAERNFDEDSYNEVEEHLMEQDPDEEDHRAYFPVEDSKPPHY